MRMHHTRNYAYFNRYETLFLIQEFKKYPCIYDHSDPEYAWSCARNITVWRITAAMQDIKPAVTPRSVIYKIRILIHRALVETQRLLKSRAAGVNYKPGLWCYEELSFLPFMRNLHVHPAMHNEPKLIDFENGQFKYNLPKNTTHTMPLNEPYNNAVSFDQFLSTSESDDWIPISAETHTMPQQHNEFSYFGEVVAMELKNLDGFKEIQSKLRNEITKNILLANRAAENEQRRLAM